MARIELSNIGGGGTTLSLTTTGTSGASTLAGSVLNIPVYQGQLTLTTTGTSGAATLSGDILNIPQYSGGGGTPAGSAGQVQFNSTPAGSFAASANLAWDNSNVRLNVGAPSAPTGRLNIKGAGATTTVGLSVTNSSNTSLIQSLDNGNVGFGQSSPAATVHIKSQSNASGAAIIIENPEATPTGIRGSVIYASGSGQTTAGSNNSEIIFQVAGPGSSNNTQGPNFGMRGNVYTRNADQRGFVFFAAGDVSTPVNNDGVLRFISPSSFIDFNTTTSTTSRLRIYNAGEVGVGTGSTTPSARLQVRGSNTTAAVGTFIVEDGAATPVTIYRIDNDGKVTYRATNTTAGTTGPRTINQPSGTVNFAIGASALVVTNSLCTVNSIVFATVRTNDATAQIKNVVPAAGSFTINLSAAATAETSVGFFIIN